MAGILHLEQFQEPALRALVDLTAEETPLTMADAFLPTETTFNRRFAYDIIQNQSFIAEYMGYGDEPAVVDKGLIGEKSGEIALFGLQHILTYEELQSIAEARSTGEHNAAIDALTVKAVDLLNANSKLMNLAKMEALTKGRFEATGNVKVALDYGIPAANKKVWAPGADLNTADFDFIGYLTDEVDKYVVANGKVPETMWISREINAKLLRNKNIILESGREVGAIRASQKDLDAVLDSFGLPSVTVIGQRSTGWKDTYTDTYITKEFLPVNRIVMLSKGVGKYLLGPTLENNFKPGIYLKAEDLQHPIRSIIQTFGAGLPILETPSLVHHIDAYTP